ncbi:MAG: hypothetical protein FWF96_05395, partial [Kiritimatiellaeota bacterium]|nr:hypothetical protein [Kiritimatiellota bacterium]
MTRLFFPALIFSAAAVRAFAQEDAATNAAPVVVVTAARLPRTLPEVAGFVSVAGRGGAEMDSALTLDQA